MPDEETQAALYETTQEATEAAGLPAYEISNHARAGAECRHNLAYWRYRDYAGIGPGAHGRVTREGALWATETWPHPERWLAAVRRRGHGRRRCTPLDADQRRDELLLMGLRLARGVARGDFVGRVGDALESALDPHPLAVLTGAGLLELDDAGLRATAAGRRRLDSVIERLVS